MTNLKEEAYVLEKIEISEDEDDDFEYKEIKDTEEGIDEIPVEQSLDDDDDLNDFTALKTKTEMNRLK